MSAHLGDANITLQMASFRSIGQFLLDEKKMKNAEKIADAGKKQKQINLMYAMSYHFQKI